MDQKVDTLHYSCCIALRRFLIEISKCDIKDFHSLVAFAQDFDFELILSPDKWIRKASVMVISQVLSKLFAIRYSMAAVPETKLNPIFIKGPFHFVGSLVYIGFDKNLNTSSSFKFNFSHLSKQDNVLLNYVIQRSQDKKPLILGVCFQRTLEVLAYAKPLDCFPDPSESTIFVDLKQSVVEVENRTIHLEFIEHNQWLFSRQGFLENSECRFKKLFGDVVRREVIEVQIDENPKRNPPEPFDTLEISPVKLKVESSIRKKKVKVARNILKSVPPKNPGDALSHSSNEENEFKKIYSPNIGPSRPRATSTNFVVSRRSNSPDIAKKSKSRFTITKTATITYNTISFNSIYDQKTAIGSPKDLKNLSNNDIRTESTNSTHRGHAKQYLLNSKLNICSIYEKELPRSSIPIRMITPPIRQDRLPQISTKCSTKHLNSPNTSPNPQSRAKEKQKYGFFMKKGA